MSCKVVQGRKFLSPPSGLLCFLSWLGCHRAAPPRFCSQVSSYRGKKKIKKKGKKRESLKKKGKSFCKNVVIPAPDSRVEAAGTPGDLTSALPYEAQGLGADHFHPVAVSTAGEFLEDWELKFLRGWMDRLSKGQRG